MQNQMMAMKSVENLSSADRRDATFLNTWKKYAYTKVNQKPICSLFTINPSDILLQCNALLADPWSYNSCGCYMAQTIQHTRALPSGSA